MQSAHKLCGAFGLTLCPRLFAAADNCECQINIQCYHSTSVQQRWYKMSMSKIQRVLQHMLGHMCTALTLSGACVDVELHCSAHGAVCQRLVYECICSQWK